ncbi:MAG: Mth938-like domain-containing protein [Steroidobacteraceae bacterium]
MKLTLDARTDVNLIRGYAAGAVRIGERLVSTPCIVAADTLITGWEPASATELAASHLEPVFALNPQVVLLGTSAAQRFPSAQVREAFASRGIGLEPMDFRAACRTYNILVQEERRVVALLFPS